MKRLWLPLAMLLLAGCAGTAKKPSAPVGGHVPPGPAVADAVDCRGFRPYPPAQEDPATRGDYVAGGLYRPGVPDSIPDDIPNVACIPEPRVVHEPRSAYGNRSPYQVLGRTYHVLDSAEDYVETGVASYYGAKFHGRRTSNQEVYDMYAFSAAHRTLPLPSYARVTNLDNGRSVVVRVNDRGPFHDGRLIDLSYAAAVKLDIHRRGTGRVEVRALRPGEVGGTLQASTAPPPAPPAPAPATASGMDALVGQLATPAPAPQAATVVASAAPAGRAAGLADHPGYGREEDRFRLVDDNGRVRSADEFDAWMRARQARLAEADRAVAGGTGAAPAAAEAPSPPAPPAATAAVPTGSVATAAPVPDAVTLQVGVFSVRDNAERVLATLRGAGIPQAWMQDVASAGRTLWRVRVGPVAEAALGELSARVSGLGLGMPQVVRD